MSDLPYATKQSALDAVNAEIRDATPADPADTQLVAEILRRMVETWWSKLSATDLASGTITARTGALNLQDLVERSFVFPEDYGAVESSIGGTNLYTSEMRAFFAASCDKANARKGKVFIVPYGIYRINDTCELTYPQCDLIMLGSVAMEYGSRKTALRVFCGYADTDHVGVSGYNGRFDQSQPTIRLRAMKQGVPSGPAVGKAAWVEYSGVTTVVGGSPATGLDWYKHPWPESTHGTVNETPPSIAQQECRKAYVEEQCCGIEIARSSPNNRVIVDESDGFCIGVRIGAYDYDSSAGWEWTAFAGANQGTFDIRSVGNAKVGVMLCCRSRSEYGEWKAGAPMARYQSVIREVGGVWYRYESDDRVASLSAPPSNTTIGVSETGADGCTWTCRQNLGSGAAAKKRAVGPNWTSACRISYNGSSGTGSMQPDDSTPAGRIGVLITGYNTDELDTTKDAVTRRHWKVDHNTILGGESEAWSPAGRGYANSPTNTIQCEGVGVLVDRGQGNDFQLRCHFERFGGGVIHNTPFKLPNGCRRYESGDNLYIGQPEVTGNEMDYTLTTLGNRPVFRGGLNRFFGEYANDRHMMPDRQKRLLAEVTTADLWMSGTSVIYLPRPWLASYQTDIGMGGVNLEGRVRSFDTASGFTAIQFDMASQRLLPVAGSHPVIYLMLRIPLRKVNDYTNVKSPVNFIYVEGLVDNPAGNYPGTAIAVAWDRNGTVIPANTEPIYPNWRRSLSGLYSYNAQYVDGQYTCWSIREPDNVGWVAIGFRGSNDGTPANTTIVGGVRIYAENLDCEVVYPSSHGARTVLGLPRSGRWAVGDRFFESGAGQMRTCTTAGYASNAWAAGPVWINGLYTSDGKLYQAMNSGTSVIAPTHSSGDATHDGITWRFVSSSFSTAVFA